jgi:hypothetical protein
VMIAKLTLSGLIQVIPKNSMLVRVLVTAITSHAAREAHKGF